MKLQTVSIFVDDQQHALEFYTRHLGFSVADDIPLGEARWLTVVDSSDPSGTQISLEPKGHPAAAAYTRALKEDGIPVCMFAVDDIQAEFDRLTGEGVEFRQPPTEMGPVTIAVLDDTCGNYIQIAQFNE